MFDAAARIVVEISEDGNSLNLLSSSPGELVAHYTARKLVERR